MVKNGKNKLCDCGKSFSISHRYHGRYRCSECIKILVLSSSKLARDFSCQHGALCDSKFIYATYSCPKWCRFNAYDPCNWEEVNYSWIGDQCISISRKKLQDANESDYNRGSDSFYELVNWGFDFREK